MAAAAAPDSDKILDKIDDNLLSCSICLEQYKSPKILPCLHTFCEQCLVTFVEKKKGVLSCPTCSTPCPLPSGVSGLKASFFINSLMEIVKQGPIEVSKPGLCEGCEENTASHRCVDCSLNFCPSCTKTHKTIPATRGHQVITLDEYKQSTPATRLSHNKVYCTVHPENVVKFYCDTCQEAVCSDCTVVEHRIPEHVHKSLQVAADEFTVQLKEMVSKVKAKEKAAKRCKQEAEQTIDKLKQQYLDEKESVKKKAEEIILKAQREEQRLVSELEAEYSRKIKQAEVQLDDWEMKHGNISSTGSYLETLVHHGSPAQLVSTKQETVFCIKEMVALETESTRPMFVRFQPVEEGVEHGMLGLLRSDVCVSQCTVENIPKHVVKGDSVNLVIRTKDNEGRQVIPYQEVKVEVRRPDGSQEDIQVTDNKDGTHAVTVTAQDFGTLQVIVTVGGQPTPGSPFTIPVNRLKTLGRMGSGEGEFNRPRRTVLSKHGDFITADSDNHRIQITDQDGNFKSSFTFTDQFQKPFKPMDIAVSADDKLFMTDWDNKQVVVSDEKGHLVRCFGQNKIKYPNGITISPVDGSVYVTDWDGKYSVTVKEGHCVIKYTQDGKFINSFGKYGFKEGEFRGPSSVVINSQGIVFVSDYDNDCIHVFNANCQYMNKIGHSGTADGELYGVTCIDTDKDGYLYVTDVGDRIQKFNSSGRFICRIDSEEDGLSSPKGITVLSSGSTCRLVVADTGNHCIKVFAV
ncbi:tripartite motif-containing protein 2-like [Glandiceps talaboti]